MFSTSVASAQLFLQLGPFRFSRDVQMRSQTIPLHHLKKYSSAPVILTFENTFHHSSLNQHAIFSITCFK